jgi:hypothetical protein
MNEATATKVFASASFSCPGSCVDVMKCALQGPQLVVQIILRQKECAVLRIGQS